MSKKQWHWKEREYEGKRERDRETEQESERERDIETGKDMHSIIVSTCYGDPGAQYFQGIFVEKYIYFIIWQWGTQTALHISNPKQKCCLLMELLLGTSLFFMVLYFLEKSEYL